MFIEIEINNKIIDLDLPTTERELKNIIKEEEYSILDRSVKQEFKTSNIFEINKILDEETDTRRNVMTHFLLTKRERRLLENYAEDNNMDLSNFIRNMIFNYNK